MNMNIFDTARRPLQIVKTLVSAALVLTLAACGGGGSTPVTDVTTTPSGLRALSADITDRKAVNYMPYRTSETRDARPFEDVTDAEVLQDLTLLKAAGFDLIRIFDSDEKVAQRVLRVIDTNSLDIKVYLGIWMEGDGDEGDSDPGNKDQMARGVALANSYPGIVVAVSVGNESLVSWSEYKIPVEELAANIKTVREQIKQPVTTDDNWAYYAAADRSILDVIDFAAVHTYAMVDTYYLPKPWDWQQRDVPVEFRAGAMMDAAIAATKADYQAARNFLDTHGQRAMPIVIGETGWMNKDPGDGWYKFLAHPVNQKMYFDRLTAWAAEGKAGAGPKNVFYFEAFDEPWKGKDDGWGLFNKFREARYAIQGLKNNGSDLAECPFSTATLDFIDQANNCKWIWEAGTYTEADAIYFEPPTLNDAVTTPKYIIHSEAVTDWPAGLRADAYETFTFALAYPAFGDSAPGDLDTTLAASNYISLSNFTPKDYGWGFLWQSAGNPVVSANMTNFANGAVHFSVKTAYVGKLRVGISSDTELGSPVEANVLVSSGNFGYCNTAIWCDVSIPLSAFKTANPELDLRYILTRFSVADIFSETGNAARSGMPEIRLDNIYWAQ